VNARGTRTRGLLVRRLLAGATVALVAIVAVGCSSGADSTDDSKTTVSVAARTDSGTTEADLKAASAASATANIQNTPDAYAYLSASCQDKFTDAEWATNLDQIIEGLRSVVPAMEDGQVGVVSVRNLTPTSAEVQVTYVDSKGADIVGADTAAWTSWLVEDGLWVTDECSTAKDFLTGS
jgi:hypothetical protein